jgi:hypothetical protein
MTTPEQRLRVKIKAAHERLTLNHAIGHECVVRFEQAGGGAAGTEALRSFLSAATAREAAAKFASLANENRFLEGEIGRLERKLLDANSLTWEPA